MSATHGLLTEVAMCEPSPLGPTRVLQSPAWLQSERQVVRASRCVSGLVVAWTCGVLVLRVYVNTLFDRAVHPSLDRGRLEYTLHLLGLCCICYTLKLLRISLHVALRGLLPNSIFRKWLTSSCPALFCASTAPTVVRRTPDLSTLVGSLPLPMTVKAHLNSGFVVLLGSVEVRSFANAVSSSVPCASTELFLPTTPRTLHVNCHASDWAPSGCQEETKASLGAQGEP